MKQRVTPEGAVLGAGIAAGEQTERAEEKRTGPRPKGGVTAVDAAQTERAEERRTGPRPRGDVTAVDAARTERAEEKGGAAPDPDQAVVDDARTGDTGAFETLVLRYQTKIINYASAMVHDTGVAEDIAQETFVRAWRGLERFRGESTFKTWLYRIATNVARTHLDRRGRQGRAADRSLDDEDEVLQAGDVPSAAPDAETALVTREAIDRALGELPGELRTALVLRDVEGLDYKEIAAVTGAPMGTVESRIFRARRHMRTLLRPLVTGRQAKG